VEKKRIRRKEEKDEHRGPQRRRSISLEKAKTRAKFLL
jgi:hypothetical protein